MAATYWLTAAVTFCWHVCGFFKCRRSRSSWPLWEGPYRRPVWAQPTAGWHHHRDRTGQPHLLLSSSSSADSAFLLCIRSISDMSSGFLCVSAWSMKTCDLLVLIYIHMKQFIAIFFSSLWYSRLLKWATVGCFYLFIYLFGMCSCPAGAVQE